MPATAFLIRIALRDVKPAIYRDVLVDPAITLRKLHAIVQAAMGWENAHLHAFALPNGSERFWRVPKNRVWTPRQHDGWGDPGNDDARCRLSDVMSASKDKLLYLYDFGDDWEHTITLRSIVETDAALPHLVKAQNGCPPEDCGGPPGAEHWSAAWFDPQHPDHDEAREVLGQAESDEPGSLDFEALQKAVSRLQPKPRRPKKA